MSKTPLIDPAFLLRKAAKARATGDLLTAIQDYDRAFEILEEIETIGLEESEKFLHAASLVVEEWCFHEVRRLQLEYDEEENPFATLNRLRGYWMELDNATALKRESKWLGLAGSVLFRVLRHGPFDDEKSRAQSLAVAAMVSILSWQDAKEWRRCLDMALILSALIGLEAPIDGIELGVACALTAGGEAAQMLQEWQDGLICLNQAVRLKPACGEHWRLFGLKLRWLQGAALEETGQVEAALDAMRLAVVENAESDEAALAEAKYQQLKAQVQGGYADYQPILSALGADQNLLRTFEGLTDAMTEGDARDHAGERSIAEAIVEAAKHERVTVINPATTLELQALLALESDDRDEIDRLRPLLEEESRQTGARGVDALVILAEIAARRNGDPTTPLLAALDRGVSELGGVTRLHTTYLLANHFLRLGPVRRAVVLEPVTKWFACLVAGLENYSDWGTPEAQLTTSKLIFSELELVAYFGAIVACHNDNVLETLTLRRVHRLFALLNGLALRLFQDGRANSEISEGEWEAALRLSRAAVAGVSSDEVDQLRHRLLALGHGWRRVDRPVFKAGHGDDFSRPQMVLFQTDAFQESEEVGSHFARIDNFSGEVRLSLPALSCDIHAVVRQIVNPHASSLDFWLGEGLHRLLPTSGDHPLPTWFGLRTTGLLQNIPWAALPMADETPIGACSVPVLLSGYDPDFTVLEHPIALTNTLVVADPFYQLGQQQPPTPDLVFDPLSGNPVSLPEALECLAGLSGDEPQLSEVPQISVCSFPLPGSRIEALVISGLTRSRRPALLGHMASPTVVKRALADDPPTVLHFAVHGIADPARPERSHLLLSLSADDPWGEPEALAFDEITLLDLKDTALVVLSACSTLDGRTHQAEGILALAWAVRAAGARAVIAARWPVNDLFAVSFWRRFYGELAAGQSLVHALLAAQRWAIEHPLWNNAWYWASYQLVI